MGTPKHILGVSAYIENSKGEILLVKTHFRSDTWEIPGGQVENGKPLHMAVVREVYEETGITIRSIGITGIYHNRAMDILSVVFYTEYVHGEISIQPSEIQDAKFVQIDETNIDKYLTRPHFKSRIMDASKKSMYHMNLGAYIPMNY